MDILVSKNCQPLNIVTLQNEYRGNGLKATLYLNERIRLTPLYYKEGGLAHLIEDYSVLRNSRVYTYGGILKVDVIFETDDLHIDDVVLCVDGKTTSISYDNEKCRNYIKAYLLLSFKDILKVISEEVFLRKYIQILKKELV